MTLFFIHNSVYIINCKEQKKEIHIHTLKQNIPGVLITFIIGALTTIMGKYLGFPVSLLALFAGIMMSFLYPHNMVRTGIDFSSKTILRFGVAFLGFRIVFDDVLMLGWESVLMVMGAIIITIIVGIISGRLLGVRPEFGALTGGAVSICGASAAMAIASILPDYKSKERDVTLTIIGITAFSTTAMVAYPFLGGALHLSSADMALFLGGTIHDVAQTAGAGYSISPEVGDLAVLTKMIRVAFLLPVVVGLMVYFRAKNKTQNSAYSAKVPIPIFLFAFIAFIAINSTLSIPASVSENINIMSRQALITAIVAIGLKTNMRALIDVGIKPIILITVQSITMIAIVLGVIAYI